MPDSHATGSSAARIADLIRPALNEYPDGTMRLTHGREDLAEAVVKLVLSAAAQVDESHATPDRVAVVTAVFALKLDEGETAADLARYIEKRCGRILLSSVDSVHVDSFRETRRR